MDLQKLFWEADLNELENGYKYDNDQYVCLICGEAYEDGVIYKVEEKFLEAKKVIQHHITNKHQSMLHYLLDMDKKYTSLTDAQKSLIQLFASGMSDKDIAKELDASPSTIRNHRFTFREKAKQAKIFLTIMNLMERQDSPDPLITIHRGATNVDERYAITETEKAEAIKKYFDENNKLLKFPNKQKRIIIILQVIANAFELSKIYNEKEVNDIIKTFYDDYVTIRRYLIEYGFLSRTRDCKEYWVVK